MSIEESFQSPIILLNAQHSGKGRQGFLRSFVNEWFSDYAVSREPSSYPEANTFGASKETVADGYNPPVQMHRLRHGSLAATLP
jgi:hypothetical protein